MANTIRNSGNFTYTQDGLTLTNLDTSISFNVTSSEYVQHTTDVNNGAWLALATSSLSNIRYAVFKKLNESGSIGLAIHDTGAGNTFAKLVRRNDVAMFSWSGSTPPLYASGSTPTSCSFLYSLHSEEHNL